MDASVLGPLLGALAGAFSTALAAWGVWFVLRKRERRKDEKSNLEDRQSDQSFQGDQYRKQMSALEKYYQRLLEDHRSDTAEMKEQIEILKGSYSHEVHDLRDKLQVAENEVSLLKTAVAVRDEQLKHREERIKYLESRS